LCSPQLAAGYLSIFILSKPCTLLRQGFAGFSFRLHPCGKTAGYSAKENKNYMTQAQKISLFFLRVVLGWMYLYAGATKIINPNWSAAGYLKSAKTFSAFYQWLASPGMLPLTNFVNEWGLTLLGLSLIFGLFVRFSSTLGAVMMFLFYLPILEFPYVGQHSYIVDEHIIYITALLVLGSFKAGRAWGLEEWCINLPICSRYPRLREWLG
jgi:thiosulfate dehydrogenase [quinone] large subunit